MDDSSLLKYKLCLSCVDWVMREIVRSHFCQRVRIDNQRLCSNSFAKDIIRKKHIHTFFSKSVQRPFSPSFPNWCPVKVIIYLELAIVGCNQMATILVEMSSWTAINWNVGMKTAFYTNYMINRYLFEEISC